MNSATLTPQQLRNAADLQEKIQGLQERLNELLGGEVSAPAQARIEPGQPPQAPSNGRKKRKKVSAEGRANIAAAQRARWAARRGEAPAQEAPAISSEEKPKRKMTAAWRKALSLAAKARWAKAKGSGDGEPEPAEKPKKKRNISEAGRRAMSLAGKRRWAKARRAARLGV
jgi:hypothetical protein